MLSKRISKPPQAYFAPVLNIKRRKKKKVQKVVKPQLEGPRCHYQVIPNPTKYALTSTLYQIYGDLIVTEHKGTLVTDLALINNFKRYPSVSITQLGNVKAVTVLPESLETSTASSSKWKTLVQGLRNCDDPKFVEWGRKIETYCKTFEQIRSVQLKRRKTRNLKQKEADSEVTRNTEKIKARIFSEHPFSCLKRRFKGNDFQLVEMTFSEKFLSILGYSIDTYVSLVLKEGLPQFETYNEEGLKMTMDDFSQLGQKTYPVEEYTSYFILKCGYIRQVTYEVYHLPNYEDGAFGLDTVVAILSKESPIIDPSLQINREIREDFLSSAVCEDEDAAKFFRVYYNESKAQRYKCMDKVCQIRELPVSCDDEELIGDLPESHKVVKLEDDKEFTDETSKEESEF